MANPKLTSNEHVDAFRVFDPNITMTGYVDGIEPNRQVGPNKVWVLKFILNNGEGRRVRVVLWDKDCDKYCTKIVNREVIRITRAFYRPIDVKFFPKNYNILPNELVFGKKSTLTTLGQYKTDEMITCAPEPTVTSLEHCLNINGRVIVEGFVKDDFEEISTKFSTYGNGSITDGKFKLNIKIINFHECNHYPTGTHVRVEGEINEADFLHLKVDSLEKIQIVDKKIFTEQQLENGVYTPEKKQNEPGSSKRTQDSSSTLNDSNILKKLCFDAETEHNTDNE